MDPPSFFPHPDSASSSPRSRPDNWENDNPLPPVPGAKLRLMCSYGGHIIPRPHDKSLCYVGGDTRIVVADRHSSLSDLHARLSHTLLNGRHFTLKYQLPTEDLDSLISLSTDEDLENMIEEYDRTNSASPLKPSRLRLFLFPSKPETAASMGSLLDDAKSETWFVDALNGSGLLPRGLSESAAIDTLLELDHRHHQGMVNSDSSVDLEAQHNECLGNNNKQVVGKGNNTNAQEVVVLDSPPMVETSSSFGSSSSSPSMANLPPIKVRTEGYHQMVGLDEQFSHVSIMPNAASPPPPSFSTGSSAAAAYGGGENLNRVIGDDEKSEKSDHGMVAPSGLRKPPLPLQPVQRKLVDVHNLPSPDSKHVGAYNLPSPDSVASDSSSIASVGSLSKHAMYQDASQVVNRVPTPAIDQKTMMMMSNNNTNNNINQEPSPATNSHQLPVQQQPPPYQNQQFIHQPPTHYIHAHHPQMPPMSSTSSSSSSSYYHPMYLHPQQSNIHHHTQTDPQQYHQMYLLPSQPLYDPTASGRALTPPPLYQTQSEMMAAGGGGATQMLVHHQYQPQQQYIGLSQMPAPSAGGGGGGGGNSNYGYEYSTHHGQDQVYYAQPPPQYQTMTSAAAVMLSQANSSAQLSSDSNVQQS